MEYPIPGFDKYFVTEDGSIISYARGKRRVMKPRAVGKSQDGRTGVYLGRGNQFLTTRIIAAAKYKRWPEPWEQVRHKDGNRFNNSMDNLYLGCVLLNVIDDLENGSRETSIDYLEEAIDRLMALREAHK